MDSFPCLPGGPWWMWIGLMSLYRRIRFMGTYFIHISGAFADSFVTIHSAPWRARMCFKRGEGAEKSNNAPNNACKYIWVHRIFSSSFWESVWGTLSIQLHSSELLLNQTGRWNISMITIIRVLVCNNEIGPWVKTLSVINIAPLLKMMVLISASSSCFTHWAWTNLQVASIEDPVWILKTFCTYCSTQQGLLLFLSL